MQIQAKKVLFHISQLLLVIAIISTGMPVKAAGLAEFDATVQTQNLP